MTTITERLNSPKVVILDGGVSTEIQKRGVSLDPNVWSGLATKTNPDAVQQVHEDYIQAGSEVITANTYSTGRHLLESISLGHEAKLLNFKSVQLAKQARDNVAQDDVWIAGSMSSMAPFSSPHDITLGKHAEASYQELAEVLAESGVDLIIAEMMRDVENATMVLKAALSTGLPVWVGYSTMMADNGVDVKSLRWKETDTNSGQDFSSIVQTVSELGGQAAGIMHTRVENISPALDVLSKHWAGPKLVYAETGQFKMPEWDFEQSCLPEDYALEIENWINKYGIKIVGGCCGTGPEHIRVLKDRLN